tara:strand:+ start:1095 stop:1322 length:228 start_codon:yes stop_codon:yes gene_type:complete
MNVKSIFGTMSDVLGGFAGVLGGLVSVGILSQVVFGSVLGLDIIGNINGLVNSFLTGGLTGLLTLIVLIGLWDNK